MPNGPIDVLVNNAGIIQVGPVESMLEADYEESLRVHFWASLYTSLEVLPEMKAHGCGRIVNIASIGGKVAVPHMLPYTAGKFALVGFSNGLRGSRSPWNRGHDSLPGAHADGQPLERPLQGPASG